MRKLLSVFMALVMVFAMSVTAFADEEKFTLTITGAAGHVYDIYQIYTGDVSANDDGTSTLSNVKYGMNHYPAVDKIDTAVNEDELKDLVKAANPAAYLETAIKGEPYKNDVTPGEGESTIVIEGIPAGYYMIKDVTSDTALPDGQTKSPIILQILETVTVASKHASISSEKKVDDKNDSDTSEDGKNWQDSADYDIGDDVPFQLSVKLPTTLNTYDTYELTFHDQQAAGFDAPENFIVKILDKDGNTKVTINQVNDAISDGFQVVNSCTKPGTCEYGNDCSFTVRVGDIKVLYGNNTFADGDQLVVEYTAKLNDSANVGRTGNENSMYVCHPDGHTLKDDVTVLTYELKVNKIDGTTKEALEGAGFTLYKKAADGNWVPVGNELKGDKMTSFIWSGIDAGVYKLVETTTPTGYNTIADIEFKIDATHKAIWLADGNYALEDVIAKNLAGTSVVFNDKNAEGSMDGKLEGDIENFTGTVLPETGAQGTLMLIGGGSLFVLVAAVFMITRKKMSVYAD